MPDRLTPRRIAVALKGFKALLVLEEGLADVSEEGLADFSDGFPKILLILMSIAMSSSLEVVARFSQELRTPRTCSRMWSDVSVKIISMLLKRDHG